MCVPVIRRAWLFTEQASFSMRSLVVAIKRSSSSLMVRYISITIPRYILGLALNRAVKYEYDTCTTCIHTHILYFWLFEHAVADVCLDLRHDPGVDI